MQSYSEVKQACLRIKNAIQQLEQELNQLKTTKTDFSDVLDRLATKHIEMSLLREQIKAQSLPLEACI